MNASAALLPFDVRPAHRETLDSYSNRLLAANFCDDAHRKDLSRTFASGRSADAMREGWMRALTTKTKRTTLHLTPDLASRLFDGRSECTHFQNTLPRRFACTHCTHGATVEQYPHFDDIVCIRHGRWTGLWTHADHQQQTTPDAVKAQILFAKLRRKNLIDVRLYLLTTKALAHALHPSLPIEQAEPLVFPLVIGLIHAITADSFARRFFDPALPFTDAHSHLDAVVTATIGHASPTVVRSLWIYMHPTVLTLNNAILLNTPHTADWVHDYPLRPRTA
ncbi:MAG: hypothetical protein LH624_01465, partial [Cryobacterium sp.]|nr:hypothetical protein [Cryobacterium sp.]